MGFGSNANIDDFDRNGESHGKVDIALADVLLKALGQQHGADEDEEGQRQHLDGGVLLDEGTDLVDEEQHHQPTLEMLLLRDMLTLLTH